jgi:hypothetical protein
MRSSHARIPAGGQLILRDAMGRVVEQWVLKQSKNTLGSANNCSIKSSLPGLEPLHVLIVNGARQCFVRALAPGLTQDGISVNELLLTGPHSHFEVAGHRFELLRGDADITPSVKSQPRMDRMRFALARPLTLSKSEAKDVNRDPRSQAAIVDAPWVSNLIRRTIEPLEAQIESLLMPIAELQAQATQAQISNSLVVEQAYESAEKKLSDEITALVARQSATMESLSERLRDVNHQLSTIERIIAEEENTQAKQSPQSDEIAVQRTAIEQLQSGMVTVTESLGQLHEKQQSFQQQQVNWKSEVQLQLDQFSQLVEQMNTRVVGSAESDSSILEAIQDLQTSQQHAQEEIQRWQYAVQQQLENLENHLQNGSNSQPTPEKKAADGKQLAEHPSNLPQEFFEQELISADSLQSSETQWDNSTTQAQVKLEPAVETKLEPTNPKEAGLQSSVQQQNWLDQWSEPHIPKQDTLEDLGYADTFQSRTTDSSTPTDAAWQLDSLPPSQWTAVTEESAEPTIEPWNLEVAVIETNSTRELALSNQQSNREEGEFFFDGAATVEPEGAPVNNQLETLEDLSPFDIRAHQSNSISHALEEDSTDQKPALPSWWSHEESERAQAHGLDTARSYQASDSDLKDQTSESFDHESGAQNFVLRTHQSDLLQSLRDGLIEDQSEDVQPNSIQFDNPPRSQEFNSGDGQQADQQSQLHREQKLNNPATSEEDSVEEYMSRLLARMRGDAPAPAPGFANTPLIAPSQATKSLPKVNAEPIEDLEPLNAENFVSRSNAPEKVKNISAFRELANSSARTAIHKSSRQRYISTGLYKIAMCVIGLTVAAVLLAINGLALNIGLVATLASMLVALIWGYDGVMSFKPLLRSGFVLPPPAAEESEEELADQAENQPAV